jgi:SpoIID/LytB domain protein
LRPLRYSLFTRDLATKCRVAAIGLFLVASTPVSSTDNTSTIELRIGTAQAGGTYAVVTVPLEAYVARVLTAEALPDSRPAALEALAITIRTYALANLGRHGSDGFDLCDETHCQVMRAATTATERAAAATSGRILIDRGAPASVFYSASCGGRTEVPSAVWPGEPDRPFLPTQDDDACRGAPVWATELASNDLFRSFRAAGFRGDRLRDLKILSRNSSGRVARLRLEGLQPDEISGQDLRVVVGRTLGWQHIKSTAFDLTRTPDGYRLRGHGSGHGVGLCVIGSARRAEAGEKADDILHRYFPGLPIAQPPDAFLASAARKLEASSPADDRARPESPASAARVVSDMLIALPPADEPQRGSIIDLTAEAREELARTLGVAAPALTLRFHSTADSYERATALPWFTSGAVVGGAIHLLPVAALRDRGVLERTIRRELVRVMTAGALSTRPLWVREGAAVYFADQPPTSNAHDRQAAAVSQRVACPEDSDLLRPVSAGALTDAYARARACFERQLAQGRSWREVR